MAHTDLTMPKHYCVGGMYVKELFLEHVGDTVLSHKHSYDHLSLVASGRVRVTVEGQVTEYAARSAVTVLAGKEHLIEALEPNSLWYCIHQVPENLRGEALLDDAVMVRGSELVG